MILLEQCNVKELNVYVPIYIQHMVQSVLPKSHLLHCPLYVQAGAKDDGIVLWFSVAALSSDGVCYVLKAN